MFYSIQLQCTISQDKILLTSTFYKIEINYQIFDRVLLYSSLNIVKLLVLAWSYPGQDPHQVYPLWITRGRGHYMAQKENYSHEIFPYLCSVSPHVSLFSVCYQATNVSPIFLCVTVKQMLV